MKKVTTILFLLGLIASISSCKKDEVENRNFYEQEYRNGFWINQDLTDTLEFTSFSTVIRKGAFYNEIYSYWFEGETLFLSNGAGESSHLLMEAKNDKVTIDNMYISIEFYNNSGTFFKDSQN